MTYDALLVLSFGGPEGPDDVMPFLENVTRGRGVPRERLLEVAEHYQHFGGVSPINGQVQALIEALRAELGAHGHTLPVYWGNRNWHPMLEDTVRQMRDDGVTRALAFATSAYGSYSGCRQYRDDIARACAAVEGAPGLEKLRPYFDHPGFIEAQTDRVRDALSTLPEASRGRARLVFTAHSVPVSMARSSPYEAQLRAASALVSKGVGVEGFELVWQSRSGPPQVPWLEPDVGDAIDGFASEDPSRPIVLVPIGFTSDHMEVVWDLDHEAEQRARAAGVPFVRAGTVGTHPAFVRAVRELFEERLSDGPRRALTTLSETLGFCSATCCPAPQRPAGPPPGAARP